MSSALSSDQGMSVIVAIDKFFLHHLTLEPFFQTFAIDRESNPELSYRFLENLYLVQILAIFPTISTYFRVRRVFFKTGLLLNLSESSFELDCFQR